MSSIARTSVSIFLALGLAFVLSSCIHNNTRRSEKSSSVVSFLYPKDAEPLVAPSLPVLRLPLRIGIAFVPSKGGFGDSFPEAQKTKLLKRVADQFRENAFIQSIEVIPTTYLRPAGGFENLDQVRGLFNLDVIVLLAYDQMQFTDQNKLSLAYWTIVGAYLLHGNKNDTHTLLEAVVYDITSRSLLFRAPGVNTITAGSTGVEVTDRLRRDSATSFEKAMDDLIANLKTELNGFKERVKNAPAGGEVARIEHRAGYKGGGSMDAWFVGALAAAGLLAWTKRRR